MYKKLLSFTLILFAIGGCGDSGDGGQVSDNLFFQSGNDQVQVQSTQQPAFGLWESAEYKHNGLTMQVRWKLDDRETILAKKCTGPFEQTVYVQVRMSIDHNLSQSKNNEITPYSIETDKTEKVADVKVMADNKPCRIAIDPANISSDSVIASDTDDFEVTEMNLSNGIIELTFDEDNKSRALERIGY